MTFKLFLYGIWKLQDTVQDKLHKINFIIYYSIIQSQLTFDFG